MKLAKELAARDRPHALYSRRADDGLHFHDVAKLLEVLHELVEQGNTVIVIEHNLEVIKTADWIIDLGPEGGDGGGEIVVRRPAGGNREGAAQLYGRVSQAGMGRKVAGDGRRPQRRRRPAKEGGGIAGAGASQANPTSPTEGVGRRQAAEILGMQLQRSALQGMSAQSTSRLFRVVIFGGG